MKTRGQNLASQSTWCCELFTEPPGFLDLPLRGLDEATTGAEPTTMVADGGAWGGHATIDVGASIANTSLGRAYYYDRVLGRVRV